MNNNAFRQLLHSLSALHWLVIALSLTLTLVAWQVSSRIAEEKARNQFDHQVVEITEQLKDRMANYAYALVSGVGAIQSHSQGLTWEEWRTFSESLALPERLPGINGIGVIYRVPPEELDAFIADQRQRRPDFDVHPPHDVHDYWPITYIEPEASNRAAIGLDMAHEINRYTAAKKAMNTGTTQITGPIVLVQDAEKTPGFLFYHPLYTSVETPPESEREDQFVGLVYAPFIMHKLLDGTLANVNRRVQLRISDEGSVLYNELSNSNENFDPDPMFETSMVIPMYGRDWTFDIQTTRLFKSLFASRQPSLILAAGIIIDALIMAVFMLLVRARTRAEARAETMTRHFDNEARKLNAVLNTVSEAIVTTGGQGFIASMNPAARLLFGERNGENIVSLFSDRFLGQFIEHSKNTTPGERFSFETVAIDLRQQDFPAHVGVGLSKSDNERLYTYTIRDLSVEKAADIAKDQFVSTVSHELRTPLTAIAGATSLLKNQFVGSADAGTQKMLDIIERNSERLTLLVSDLLDFEGFSSGNIRLLRTPTDLNQIAQKSIRDCATYSNKSNVRLELENQAAHSVASVDRDRIGQVLLNLLSNAIKFSPENGTVKIQIVNPSQDLVCLKVIDQGEGIPDSYRERAFSRFSQVDSSDAKQKAGTGLGLSISKAIIELHGGTIGYDSKLGHGSTFYFCLAVETQQAEAGASTNA